MGFMEKNETTTNVTTLNAISDLIRTSLRLAESADVNWFELFHDVYGPYKVDRELEKINDHIAKLFESDPTGKAHIGEIDELRMREIRLKNS